MKQLLIVAVALLVAQTPRAFIVEGKIYNQKGGLIGIESRTTGAKVVLKLTDATDYKLDGETSAFEQVKKGQLVRATYDQLGQVTRIEIFNTTAIGKNVEGAVVEKRPAAAPEDLWRANGLVTDITAAKLTVTRSNGKTVEVTHEKADVWIDGKKATGADLLAKGKGADIQLLYDFNTMRAVGVSLYIAGDNPGLAEGRIEVRKTAGKAVVKQ